MNVDTIVAGWKSRLNRTQGGNARFVGFAESEIADAETRLGVRFPVVFRAYLAEMGKATGRQGLFCGSDRNRNRRARRSPRWWMRNWA